MIAAVCIIGCDRIVDWPRNRPIFYLFIDLPDHKYIFRRSTSENVCRFSRLHVGFNCGFPFVGRGGSALIISVVELYIRHRFYIFAIFIFCCGFNNIPALREFKIGNFKFEIRLCRECIGINGFFFFPIVIIGFILVFVVRKVLDEFGFAVNELVWFFPIPAADEALWRL